MCVCVSAELQYLTTNELQVPQFLTPSWFALLYIFVFWFGFSFVVIFCFAIFVVGLLLLFKNTFTFMHLADAFILTVHSGYTFLCQYVCSLGIEPTPFCVANAILYNLATGTEWIKKSN